ncbi:MAG: rod shape-determining protein MreC [Clostridiales bacterium]|nr:rod shape-determining protein MreC [Clostridiales bacterium]
MNIKTPKTERKRSTSGRGRKFFRNTVVIIIVLILLFFAGMHLLVLINGNDTTAGPEKLVSRILTPIQNGFQKVVNWIDNYFYNLKLRSRLELEYNTLRQENEQLTYQAMLADELQHKLNVYETLYDDISINDSMNPLVATVVGKDPGNYFSVFVINKGSNDGVQNYMAVTVDNALIGYTYNVKPNSASVRTIIDSEASIAGLITSSRDQGTVRGTLGVNGEPMCRMYYLPEDHLPRPGDMVVTSGVGDLINDGGVSKSFPKGIPIGTVRESTRGMESNKQYIVVEPLADFQHVEYVIVWRYQAIAEDVEERASSNDELGYVPLDTVMPVPTIQIGSDFYQLAPTLTPSPEPTLEPDASPTAEGLLTDTPAPSVTPNGNLEYQLPEGAQTNNSFDFTLAPTATPTPTPPPMDFTVEED